MRLNLEWRKPIILRSGVKEGLIYTVDINKVPKISGIYIFARRWRKSYEALYVGKSKNINHRIGSHLNSLRLMRHLLYAKNGKRVLLVGQAQLRPGQKVEKVLPTLERALIRHFLLEGHDLVNRMGIRIRSHEIASVGPIPKAFVPSLMFLEKAK